MINKICILFYLIPKFVCGNIIHFKFSFNISLNHCRIQRFIGLIIIEICIPLCIFAYRFPNFSKIWQIRISCRPTNDNNLINIFKFIPECLMQSYNQYTIPAVLILKLSCSSFTIHLSYFTAQQQACIQIAVTIYTQACPRTSSFCFLLYQLSLWWVKYRAQPEAINP